MIRRRDKRTRRQKRMSYDGAAFPKPEPLRVERADEQAHEQAVIGAVREQVFARDGRCRVPKTLQQVSPCEGPRTWAHLEAWRRSRTRGQDPELRHVTAGSISLCVRHHEELDRTHRLAVDVLEQERGADGRLRFTAVYLGGTMVAHG